MEQNIGQENEETGRYSKRGQIIGIVLAVLTLVFMYISAVGIDSHAIAWFIDVPSLLIQVLACSAIAILSGAKGKLAVLKIVQKTLIPVGAFTFFFDGILILGNISDLELIGPNLAVAILTMVYGLLAYIVLIPIIARLEEK